MATQTATVKKPGPPVPPRPQHTSVAASLLKTQRESLTNGFNRAATGSVQAHPVIQKKPTLVTQTGAATAGRTVIYKSPSLNLQQKQQEREKQRILNADGTYAPSTPPSAPKPPLKMRRAPDVPRPPLNEQHNNVVIVQSAAGVNLNRHNSMTSPKTVPAVGLKDMRHSLGRADFEQVGKPVQLDQLQPAQPLPKPRKIVKMPVATLDLDSLEQPEPSPAPLSLFRRSKTTLDSLVSRANNVTTINTYNSSHSYLGGKTVELKNNLKNAAERLFSEIIVNQQKQALQPATIITKHERALQHQTLLEQEMFQESQKRMQQSVTVVSTTPAACDPTNNCTRISINSTPSEMSPEKTPEKSPKKTFNIQGQSGLISPEKKTAFHELLISELAAMRTKCSSLENVRSTDSSLTYELNKMASSSSHTPLKSFIPTVSAHTSANAKTTPRKRRNSIEDQDHDSEDVDADNIDDAIGDDDDLHKNLKVGTTNSPRKRCPSGCSSDSSPYGTERSTRIRTSDWIEVNDNGKQVTLTSCHISLEDSGLEDEERMDEMSSSGVGDSWDSVKEAENEKRSRSVKRAMSITDLPPLPKSLSGINKMLASDSGLISDSDANTSNNNCNIECQKDNNNVNVSENVAANEDDQSTLGETNGNENDALILTGNTLDTQLATLKKEMNGLRQLDLSLLTQLWALNDSIQEFRTILQEQEQDPESYSQHSHTPSSYDSVSSEGEDEITTSNTKQNSDSTPKIITTQPKLRKSSSPDDTITNSLDSTHNSDTSEEQQLQEKVQRKQRPPLPKPLDMKTVPRMRSAPPPPPTNRKSAAPPRPT